MGTATANSKAIQERMPQYLCLVLYITSLYLLHASHANVYPALPLGDVELTYNAVRTLVGAVVTAATLLAYRSIDRLIQSSRSALVAALLNTAGSLLVFVPAHTAMDPQGAVLVLLVVVGNLLAWAGTNLTMLIVHNLFVRLPSNTAGVVGAFAASMVLNALAALCSPLGCAVLQLVVPFAIYLLVVQAPLGASAEVQEPKTLQSDTVDAAGLAVGYFIFIFAFSLGTSFSRGLYLSNASPDVVTRSLIMLACTALAYAIIFITKRSYLRLNTIALYRSAFLFFVISFGCTVIFSQNGEVSYSMQFVADFLFRVLTFVVIYRICQRSALSITLVVGVTTMLRLVASLISSIANMFDFTGHVGVETLVTIFIVLFTLVYTVIFTERNMETLTERRKPRSETFIMESKCLAMAAEYGFSKRELEIVRHLCQGRTAAFIGDELFVSPRTVNTHIRNIYKKMNIHSRQEFHDAYQAQRAESARTLQE